MKYLPENPQDIITFCNVIGTLEYSDDVIARPVIASDGSHHILFVT